MTTATPPVDAKTARAALSAEWLERNPQTPEEILEFYRTSECLEDDLEAFHTQAERKVWTVGLVHIVKTFSAKVAVDVGCGAGHDLYAMRTAGVERIIGVEPNDRLRERLQADGFEVVPSVVDVDLDNADVISCFDVLEHVPDPEAFLAFIASQAKLGAILLETCATFDTEIPLHLAANRGWRTGYCLEKHGWEKVGDDGRQRAWMRQVYENRLSTAVIPVTFRSVSMPTHRSIVTLLTSDPENKLGWREFPASEAGLLRARNIAASRWYTETADDVFLMIDDDQEFKPKDAERIVTLCRNGHDIIAAAYPVRDGAHLAMRAFTDESIMFGDNCEPFEVRWAGTGFFAVHRRVLDKMIPTLRLMFAAQPWAYWPLFRFGEVEDAKAGGWCELSEDYGFCEQARALGFKVWIDPQIKLDHHGVVPISIRNMTKIKEAIDAH